MLDGAHVHVYVHVCGWFIYWYSVMPTEVHVKCVRSDG